MTTDSAMKFKNTIKHLFLCLYIFLNGLIIIHSSLDGATSGKLSAQFSNVFKNIINNVVPGSDVKTVEGETLTIEDTYKTVINNNDKYEIGLGITRRINTTIGPDNTTNKKVTYHSSDTTKLRVTSLGYLEARAIASNIRVDVISHYENLSKHFYVDIVELEAPLEFTISSVSTSLFVDSSLKLKVETPENTISRREGDIYKIDYRSNNENIAKVNKYGIITGLNPGTVTISAYNNRNQKQGELDFQVITSPTPLVQPTSISLSGETSGYVYTYLQLETSFNSDEVTETDVTFISSNRAVATVNDEGRVYGNKVSGIATITAFSNVNPEVTAEIEVNFSDVVPTSIKSKLITNVDDIRTNSTFDIEYTLTHDLEDQSIPITNNDLKIIIDDPSIATLVSSSPNNSTTRFKLRGLKQGEVTIKVVSAADETVESSTTITIKQALFIPPSEATTFEAFVRKSIGHFSLFLFTGFIGLITFFIFLFNKFSNKKIVLITLSSGLFLAALSEFIQRFRPQRNGNLLDVLIDFIGFLIGASAALLIMYLIYKKKKNKDMTVNK